jgi:two-component system CheB/CheR fusion protein
MALVGVCVAMLIRLVLAERRHRADVEDFLARVTHEMKTPLAGMKALLQTLREGRLPAERLREVVDLGLAQAEREEHLIENLLTAHRLAVHAASPPVAPLDVRALLEGFLAHRRASVPDARETCELECPPGLACAANAAAVSTILDNLADNAFKYGASRLRLAASSDGDAVRVVVQDDGEGFEPCRGEALFAAFERGGAAVVGRHGTGLGLAIARALAREMRGDLRAESDGPGRGARFVLRLPAAGTLP